MWFDLHMEDATHSNDNEPMTFERLSLAAERLLERLEKQVVGRQNDETDGGDQRGDDGAGSDRYIKKEFG